MDDLDAEVVIGPVPVLRRELLSPSGLVRLGREVAAFQAPFRRLVAERGIDLVHANTSVILGLRRHAPVLVTHVREIYPRVPLAWPLLRRRILHSDVVVCVSAATRTALGAGAVVRDGLAFDPQPVAREEARRALGLPEDAFVAAVLGRISAWKGQELLARAMQHVDGITLVAGDAWPGQEHHGRALDPYHRVHRTGFVDPDLVYGAADVVVVPSTTPDPLPNTAIEAAAAGCCVVTANHGGLPEIVTDHETGRLFPPNDQEALTRMLNDLRQSPDRRRSLGEAARRDARRRFDPARMRRELDVVYATAMAPATATTATTTATPT